MCCNKGFTFDISLKILLIYVCHDFLEGLIMLWFVKSKLICLVFKTVIRSMSIGHLRQIQLLCPVKKFGAYKYLVCVHDTLNFVYI